MFDGLLLPSLRSTRPARVELDALDRINRGLLRFYPLLLSGGSVADDISPRRVRGTITNSSPGNVGAVGPHGRAMNFNGSTYMTAGSVGSDIISVSVWARSGITGTPGWNRLLSSKYTYFAAEGFEITFVSGSNTKLGVTAGGSSGISPDVVDNWADGRWRHIGVVINKTEIAIYINGLLKGSGSASTLTSTSAAMVFGDNNAFNEARWNGGIGNARVYNRVLTAGEFQRLYREPWAGTFEPAAMLFSAMRGAGSAAYTLAVDPMAYNYAASAVGLSSARRISVAPLAYTYGAQDVGLSYRQGAHTLDVEPLAYTYGAASVGLTFSGAAAPAAGPSRTRRGARKIYLPEPQASAVFHPNALPEELAAHAVKAWQDDEDDETWFLLA